MIKRITIIAGLLLAVIGLLGLAAPHFMGLSLSSSQSMLYLASGLMALFFGLLAPPAAYRMFAIIVGGFYTALGVAGLGLGEPRLTMIPGQLVFERLDHVFHLLLGTVVLTAAWSGRMAGPVSASATNK